MAKGHAVLLTVGALVAGMALTASATRDSQSGQGQHQPPAGGVGHMDHRFDDPERYAKSFDDPARDAWQMPDRVIAALELRPGQRVADVGAGTGYFSVRLARAAVTPQVFAVDLEPKMVAHLARRAAAEKLPNISAVQATAASPNLPEPVDVVLVVDTYHHIANRPAYFSSLKASLRPGGRVAIVDFRKGGGGDGPPDAFRFTPDQISGEMAAAGFVLDRSHDFLPRQLFLVYRLP